MIPGSSARAGLYRLGPDVGRDDTGVGKRRGLFSISWLPHQFLDAWFLDERIIVEAPGYPSAEDERCRRHLPTDGRAMRSW
ncbi:MAG: hypothetical protein ABSD38_20885 [Syntrophorhabdales bacterium]